MKNRPPIAAQDAANSNDLPSVVVCFQDSEISALFAELLTSRGVSPILTKSLTEQVEGVKIVTEPFFFPKLSTDQAQRCLVVGPKKSLKSINARCLEQPLTEQKVEEALEYLTCPLPV